MKPHRRVFVVGGALTPFIGKKHPDFIWKGHPDFGQRENPTLDEHLASAIEGALQSTGVDAAKVDKGYVGNFAGELFVQQGHMGALVPRVVPALEGTPFTRVEGACASGALAVVGCIEAIQAGANVTLAAGAEVQTSVSAREGAGYLARASHFATERDLDEFTFPAMFARRAKLFKEATGTTDEDIAHVVAKAYGNANRNPNAHMRAVTMSVEDAATAGDRNPCFLRNEDYRDHLKMSDCSQVSDGGAAMLLASEDGLAALGLRPEDCVEIVSWAQRTGGLGRVTDYTRLDVTAAAAAEAYRDAGIAAGDVQVAEVHDCFAVTEILMAEALGFTAFGQGRTLAREGRSHIDGDIPINTGGGLLAFGHPVGATGVKQLLEIVRQMKGECGDYQMPTRPKVGLAANMGGDDRTSVVTVLRAG